MTDFKALLQTLAHGQVEFILAGGVAGAIHGSARLTLDIGVVYRRSDENIERLATALKPFQPDLRGAPPGLPFQWDSATLKRGLNLTLTTAIGDIDLFGEIVGGGTYDDLVQGSVTVEVFGTTCGCLGLDQLIRAKRAAGRPKDLEALAELEAIAEEQSRPKS